MSGGSSATPVVVYVDDDASARATFDRVFASEQCVVTTTAAAGLARLDTRQAALLAFEAQTLRSIGETAFIQLAELQPHTTRIVVSSPWQPEELAPLVTAACAAWSRSTEHGRALSHDLRTPLMALISDAEHLSVLAEKDPTLHDIANDMQRAARRIQQLIERLGI